MPEGLVGAARDGFQDPRYAREEIRHGRCNRHTAGLAPGYVQGNLAILKADLALDFLRYCQRNPKPCPIVGVSETGDWSLPTLGEGIDIRSDIPSYNVYRHGELVESIPDISHLWEDDFVAFIIGCSFSFEEALMWEGVPLRHVEEDVTVPMFRTSIETVPSGPFDGGMVVSMRPMLAKDAIRASVITSRFPSTHGTPVHLGDPSQIGIVDVMKPDWGDPVTFKPGEIPVFWACGVTPQNAIRQAKPEICITHTPGHMLITDLPSAVDGSLASND